MSYEQCAAACRAAERRYRRGVAESERRALNKGGSNSPWDSSRLTNSYRLPQENLDFPHAFRLIPTINFCISLLQDRIGSLPLEFFLGRDKETRRPLKRAALNVVELWEKANAEQTGRELVRDLIGSLLIQGNAYLFLDFLGTGRIQELWILDPLGVSPVPAKGGNPRVTDHYEIRPGAGPPVMIRREQIVHFRLYNPEHGILGLSPLTALQLAYETHRDSGRMIRLFYGKGGTVAGHYSTDMALDEDDRKLLREDIALQSRGPEGAWQPVLLPRQLKYVRSGLTMAEMQFIETHKLTKEEILLGYKVPPMMAGIATGTGMNSDVAKVASRQLQENAISPLCNGVIAPTLTEKFLPFFGRDLSCEFDSSGVIALQEIFLEQAEAYQRATGGPVMTRAEARKRLALEDLADPELEKLLVGISMMTEGEEPSPAPATEGSVVPDAEVPKPENAPRHASGRSQTESRDQKRDRLRIRADRSRRPHERRMERGFRRVFTRQQLRARAILRQQVERDYGPLEVRAVNVDELLQDDESDRKLIRRLIRAIVEERGEAAIAELGLDYAFEIARQEIAEWIDAKATKAITAVNETTRARLREELVTNAQEGEGFGELVARLDAVFEGRRKNVATIARTETAAPYGFANQQAWEQSGVVEGKEWISAADEAVRDTHRIADGQVVALAARFEVGGDFLDFPGDPSGSAEEIINCRCDIVPVLSLAAQSQAEALPRAIAERVRLSASVGSSPKGLPSTNGHASPRSPTLAEFLARGKP